jgi:chemotaxis protein methyltransferase WspC
MVFADFENLLKESMGLDAASIGASAIERAVMERTLACDLVHPRDYWQRVCASPAELQALIETVVVPESWFFRDREAFTTLARLAQDQSMPMPADGVLRVLSMPCSTGEEPYSIAMALLDAELPAHRFSIDAVDISGQALAAARRAIYGKNSFRSRDLEFRARHFETIATRYRLSERVRRQVHFRHANLFAPDFATGPATYDAIFCRNLLIYFDRATQNRAISVIARQLRPGGVLFVAPSETGVLLNHRFVPVKAPLAFAFRKIGEGARERKPLVSRAGRSRATSPPLPLAAVLGGASRNHVPAIPPSVSQSRAAGQTEDTGITLMEAAELANRGRFEEAFELCERHWRRSGPSAEVFLLMGLVRDASGDPADAERCYRKALYLDPNHRDVLVHLALLLEKGGKKAEAQLLRKRTNRMQQSTGPQNAPTR